jgi:predicted RNA-binding Zn ribbon-like protein
MADGLPVDLLATPAGAESWLAANDLPGPNGEALVEHLLEARAAIRAVATDRRDPAGRERFNAVLAHGAERVELDEHSRPRHRVEFDHPTWEPAVRAARNFVDLLDVAPDRIRRCEHPNCVLWFFDTSRNGARRWHSMATCGNRLKAQRHYQRTRGGDEGHPSHQG